MSAVSLTPAPSLAGIPGTVRSTGRSVIAWSRMVIPFLALRAPLRTPIVPSAAGLVDSRSA